jgi:phosphoglycolate phosphatase
VSGAPVTRLPRAALFDWDNTLIDSWATIHEAMNTTLAAMGHETWTMDQTRERVRRSLRETFPEMFGDRWEEAREVFYGRFKDVHLDMLSPMEGAEALLRLLAGRGVYLGVVSNKLGEHLRREAGHLGWDSLFGQLVGASDAEHDKPAPEPVALALSGSDIAPGADVWFVGDTGIDLECARNAGCHGILIRETGPAAGEFDGCEPGSHFSDCEGMAALVRAL